MGPDMMGPPPGMWLAKQMVGLRGQALGDLAPNTFYIGVILG